MFAGMGGKRGQPGRLIYILDSGDRALAWMLTPRASARRRADHEQLLRLIAARTRLPLRDVTAAVARLERITDEDEEKSAASSKPEGVAAAPALTTADDVQMARERGGCLRALFTTLLPLTLTLVLCIASEIWQHFVAR
jgi:hypothetical protein